MAWFPGKNWMKKSVNDIIHSHGQHPLRVQLHISSLPTQRQLAGLTEKSKDEVRQRYREALSDSRQEIRDTEATEQDARGAADKAAKAERAGSQLGPKERKKLRDASRKAADAYDAARKATISARQRHTQIEPAHRAEMREAEAAIAGINAEWRRKQADRQAQRSAAPDLSFKPERHSWSRNPPGGKRRDWEGED
jgi:hypothetical protein